MSEQQVRVLIGLIGLHTQLGITLLTVGLFAVLRRPTWRRSYFTIWGQAFAALLVAITAIVIRYLGVLPIPSDVGPLGTESGRNLATVFVYQAAKLLYFFLLAAGAARYARGVDADRLRRWGGAVVLALAVVSFVVAPSVSALVAWQAPLAIACGLYSAWVLLRLPPARRSTGSRVTGAAFAGLSLLWVLYLLTRTGAAAAFGEGVAEAMLFITRFNSYFDILAQTILAFGMVVLHMEEARRETDDAHTQLAVANDELRRIALHDALTACMNRRAFVEGLGLEHAKGTFGTVVMLDMDNLKTVNDEHGHAAGDVLLAQFAQELRGKIRPLDRLYRWGGDEFLLVLPDAEVGGVRARLEALLAEAAPIALGDGRSVTPEVSFGAEPYGGGDDLEPAIARADAQMYAHKRERKGNRTPVPETPIPAGAAER